jgi:hypothetical protein
LEVVFLYLHLILLRMKNTLSLILLFVSLLAEAQKIDLKRDIVYLDKEPVCKFLNIGTITNQAYTIKNMIDEELILIDQSQLRDAEGNALLRFMFADMPELEAFMPVSLSFRKQMARLIVTYDLVDKGKLVKKNVERFCKNYNGYFSGNRMVLAKNEKSPSTLEEKKEKTDTERTSPASQSNTMANENQPVETTNTSDFAKTETASIPEEGDGLVVRDAEQEVFLSGNTLRQDFKEIGFYTATATAVNGKDGYLITIMDIKNAKVAEAKFATDSGECELLTMKDNKVRQVTIPKSDLYTVVKDVVSKLCFLLYI